MRTRVTFVYVHLGEGPVPAGRLEMVEDGRNSFATFQYGNRYLERPDRIPVDPAALPLPAPGQESPLYRTAADFELFNGIRDAAPDGWGRYLMNKAAGRNVLTEFDYLVASGEHRIGALAFGPTPTGGPQRLAPWGDGEVDGERLDLGAMAEAAKLIQNVDELPPNLRRFMSAGSSLGGARPKAATNIAGMPWIAKFAAKEDTFPVCRTERVVMELAREVGLDVPRTDITTLLGNDIYLIERFDRRLDGNKLLRTPFASAMTMLEAHEISAHHYAYADLAGVIRRHGSEPQRDLKELFRRMAFNILVGNDDDHLRNHAFIMDRKGWRLSPLYDVVPRPRYNREGTLVLNVGDDGHAATLRNAVSGADTFGLSAAEAVPMLEEMRIHVAARWRPALGDAGLSNNDIDRLANCFAESGNARWQDGLI